MTRRDRVGRNAATVAACLAFADILVVAFAGGFTVHVAGIRLASHRVFPAWLIGSAGVFVALRGHELNRLSSVVERAAAWLDNHAAGIALGLAAFVFAAAMQFGAFTAAGADPYGYVSEADLWAHGSPVQPLPSLALDAPWPDGAQAFAPLGYRVELGRIVPVYSAGLPLMMAAAIRIAGRSAGYLIVPLCGAVAVYLTFLLGRRIDEPRSAVAAAILFAASPVFLFQLMQPMSDVPVTMWWLAAICAALGGSIPRAAVAGAATAIAILVRPNLLPLVAPVAACVAMSGSRRWHRTAVYLLAAAAGAAATSFINRAWYGDALRSGYGALADIYSLGNLGGNLVRYPAWMLDVYSPLLIAGVLAPLAVVRRDGRVRLLGWIALAFTIVLLACYATYLHFDHWTYLRFLLPATPIWFAFTSVALGRLLGWCPVPWRRIAFALVVFGLAASYLGIAIRGDAFALKTAFRVAYEDTAAKVRRETPDNAVFFAVLQSGSLRYYADRLTVRYDVLDPGGLDAAVTFLRARGYVPYAALDWTEETDFRRRFATARFGSQLHHPIVESQGGIAHVRVYRLE